MSPNPVCYNGSSQPKAAIHIGSISLGVTPKDYYADTNQKWRTGISPEASVVLYSDTYSRGEMTDPDGATPLIWSSEARDTGYEQSIIDLVSRLPERSDLNYEVFPDYLIAIKWLKNTGTYSLINSDYPEYTFADAYTGCQTIANIEFEYLGSYYGLGDPVTFNLANPRKTLGFGEHAPYALSVNAFKLVGEFKGVFPDRFGGKSGFYSARGGIIQTDGEFEIYSNGFVFEGVFSLSGTDLNQTLFELWSFNPMGLAYQVRVGPIDGGSLVEVINGNGTVVYSANAGASIFGPTVYLTVSHQPGSAGLIGSGPVIQINEKTAVNFSHSDGGVDLSGPLFWIIGSHLTVGSSGTSGSNGSSGSSGTSGGRKINGAEFSEQVSVVKSFKIHLGSLSVSPGTLQNSLHTANYPIVRDLYGILPEEV